MNLDDQVKLKFDRRLENRRGWLQPGEREAYIEGLADATDKIHDGSEDEVAEAEAPAAEAPDAVAAPAAPSVAPLATPSATPSAAPASPTTPPGTPEGGFGNV